ncbi:MAG TPA: class 1 isoprenoid biosynthesis enzyme [Symbiobacteriaceae bacterium]|nr:class 1 isoprenoid biosynthesis enzyme [Symbiobacteriaceae bacterium]
MLKAAWSRLEEHLAALAPPLCHQAAALLRNMAARNRAADAAGYFDHPDTYPTPQIIAWIGERYLPNEPHFVERILESALWLYLYIRLQDDILDDPHARREGLLLGNICVERGFGGLYRLLPDSEAFQQEAGAAWSAFSAATAWEKAEHWGRPAPFAASDLDRLGEKFAAIRLPVAAILCRAGCADLLEPYARVLQHLGTAVQMTNDLHNWEEDRSAGNFTYFLTLAGTDPARAVAGGAAAEECLAVARRYLGRALEALPPDGPDELRRHLTERLERLTARQAALIRAKLGLTGL